MKTIIAKIFNNDGTERGTLTSDEVVLEALCAYRDTLILSGEYNTLEVRSKLAILHLEIAEVANRIVTS